jgi:acyl-CoA thioester hydrolase
VTETPAYDPTDRSLYPAWHRDVLRYRDTDRQGHVNNAVFSTFLESGRAHLFREGGRSLVPPGCDFVIARLVLDFRSEIRWPGAVDIGTGVQRIGRSSMTLVQGIYVAEACAATAETVIVLTDDATRRSTPFTEAVRARLESLLLRTA